MKLLVDVAPLRQHRDFRLLWVGQGVTFLGNMITYVAVPYQLYALTGSTSFTTPRFSAGLGGALCVAGTLVLAAALPAFRNYDSRSLQREAH
jgi:hypothetical protein